MSPHAGGREHRTRSYAVFVRIFGTPPPKTASKEDALLYLRKFYVRTFFILVVPYAVGIAFSPPVWLVILAIIAALAWASGYMRIARDLRRCRAAGSAGTPDGGSD
jgi:hypothetical protein